MVRYSVLIILAGIFLISCGGGNKNKTTAENKSEIITVENDLHKENINGNVLQLRQRVYWCSEKFGRFEKGKLQNLPVQDYLKTFNEYGFLTEEIHYDATDKIVNSRKLAYINGYLLETEELYKAESLNEKIHYTYNDNKQLVKKEIFDETGTLKSKNEYIYYKDNPDLLMDEDLYDKGGNLTTKFVNKYSDVFLVERQKYWGGGSLAQTEYYTYENEKVSEIETFKYKNKEASFDKKIQYFNYSADKYTLKIEYDSERKPVSKTFYTYDNQGNLLDVITFTNREISEEEIAKVKEAAKSAEDEEDDDESDILLFAYKGVGNMYAYTYDAQNNWTQKITYKISKTNEAHDFETLTLDDVEYNSERQFLYERIYTYK